MAMRTSDKVILHPDSKYATGIAQSLFFPHENVLLSKLLRHLPRLVQSVFDVNLCWTNAHADDVGNVLADTLANDGCAMEIKTEDRGMAQSEWDAEAFTSVLEECDTNQPILVHEILEAHLKRLTILTPVEWIEI